MNIVEQLMHVALLGSAWVLYLLFGLSIISIGAILERVLFFRRNRRGADGLREGIDLALRGRSIADLEATLAKFQSVEVDVLRGALDYRRGGADAFLEAVDARIERERVRLENSMTFLGTLGNNAPFVGLFGTVIGVIEAFQHLSAGNGAGMDNVMAGIAEALIATGVGIFVALPAVVAYNVGAKRAADIEGETQSLGKLIAAWLRSEPEEGERVTATASAAEAANDSLTKRSDAKASDARLGDLAFEGSR